MKLKHIAFGTIAVAALASLGGSYITKQNQNTQDNLVRQVNNQVHIGPANLYPDPILTMGKADTLNLSDLTATNACGTYSQCHRNVSDSEKNKVCSEYPDNCKSAKEIDHFYPLCAGGSNDITNLWAQPAINLWNGQDYGFHTKDKLETYICSQIKAGKMNPQDAYERMTGDWVKFYQDLGLDKTFGSASQEPVE